MNEIEVLKAHPQELTKKLLEGHGRSYANSLADKLANYLASQKLIDPPPHSLPAQAPGPQSLEQWAANAHRPDYQYLRLLQRYALEHLVLTEQSDESREIEGGKSRKHVREHVRLPSGPCTPLNQILEGVPGTGKTHAINKIRADHDATLHAITLHPATSYEDFIEGLRPATASAEAPADAADIRVHSDNNPNNQPYFWTPTAAHTTASDRPGFTIRNGAFLQACIAAARDGNHWHVVLLDEINRCNVPKVLGDLLTTLEASKRARWDAGENAWNLKGVPVVTLPYSQRRLFVPDNLLVVATMNTTDRSVVGLDAALRRRFAIHRLWPLGFGLDEPGNGAATALLAEIVLDLGKAEADLSPLVGSVDLWAKLNRQLLEHVGPDGMLGHSYLFDLAKALFLPPDPRWHRRDSDLATVVDHWNLFILPQLAEILEHANLYTATDAGHPGEPKELAELLHGELQVGDRTATLTAATHGNHLHRRIQLMLSAGQD